MPIGLATLALVPRLVVASTADLGIDEPTYVTTGETYVRLLAARDFASPDWLQNFQHPALAKLAYGLAALAAHAYLSLDPILGARMAAVGCGVLTVELLYLLGRRTFGVKAALLAATWLALSPWHAYWSGLALLDIFLVLFLELAFLLVLRSGRNPAFALVAAAGFGLAFSSKYSAGFAVPALAVLGFASLRPRSTSTWIVAAACPIVAGAVVLGANPEAWADPWPRLLASLAWQLQHASRGQASYYAGQALTHTPWWVAPYVVVAKNSLATLGFAIAALLAAVLGVRRPVSRRPATVIAASWLVMTLAAFSLMSIAPSDSYFLPLALPLSLSGAVGVVCLADWLPERLGMPRRVIDGGLIVLFLAPQLAGLIQFPAAVGFTDELLRPGDRYLPVATTGYAQALAWIAERSPGARVAVPVFPEGARWAAARDADRVRLSDSPGDDADFLVLPAFYVQEQLGPPGLLTGWDRLATLGEGGVPYVYVYARPPAGRGGAGRGGGRGAAG